MHICLPKSRVWSRTQNCCCPLSTCLTKSPLSGEHPALITVLPWYAVQPHGSCLCVFLCGRQMVTSHQMTLQCPLRHCSLLILGKMKSHLSFACFWSGRFSRILLSMGSLQHLPVHILKYAIYITQCSFCAHTGSIQVL